MTPIEWVFLVWSVGVVVAMALVAYLDYRHVRQRKTVDRGLDEVHAAFVRERERRHDAERRSMVGTESPMFPEEK